MTLFTKEDQPLPLLLEELKDSSPEFRIWSGQSLKTGQLKKIVDALILAGRAANPKEALIYLQELSRHEKLSKLKIAKLDFNGEMRYELVKLLEQKLGYGSKPNESDPYRQYGIVGHQMIADLLSGNLFNLQNGQTGNENEESPFARQKHFFKTADIEPIIQPVLFDQKTEPKTGSWQEKCSEIRQLLQDLREIVQNEPNWMDAYQSAWPLIPELETRLSPIFQHYLEALKAHDSFSKYIRLLAMMSWSSLIPCLDKPQAPFFKELAVLNHQTGISGGRIDALEVASINGQPPNSAQTELLKQLARHHYTSVGSLVRTLYRIFGHDLSLRITDWKFASGNNSGIGQTIQPTELADPLEKYVLQVKSYITLANLDCFLFHQTGKDPWPQKTPLTQGRLFYILPTASPIIHEISITSAEQKRLFREELVIKLPLAQKHAIFRHFNNLLIGNTVNLFKGQDPLPGEPPKPAEEPVLFPDNQSQKSFQTIVEKYRRFADKLKIIEIVKRNNNGNDLFIMHLDKLAREPVEFGNFNWETGGFISCLVHQEKTPSMRINITDGFFKCFGCGVFGLLSPSKTDRVPFGKFGLKLNGKIFQTPDIKKIRKIIIPVEHHQIMSLAQQILRNRFKRSPGCQYTTERGIDPDLAHTHGAGYGDYFLINSLLDSYDLDQLIFYGFVAVSEKITAQKGLGPLLFNRGMTVRQMRRKITGQESCGLPYSVLDRRLTFPLVFEGRNTNFYGRATWPNGDNCSKHRKLSTRQTGVPQGIFNSDLLQSKHAEIIVAEGVFDALSLVQLGWPNVVSLIGVNNYLNIESVARSSKSLAIALDHDTNETGQTNTAKIIKHLKKISHPAPVRDFTTEFIAQHPDFLDLGCKDFNDYLVKTNQTA